MQVGVYHLYDKPILPNNLYKTAAILSHGLCNVSTGGIMAAVVYTHSRIIKYLKKKKIAFAGREN